MTRKLNVELDIQLIPTDKGVRLLGSCNKGYKVMTDSLLANEEFQYVLPEHSRNRQLIIYPDGEVNISIMKELAERPNITRLYSQPYSKSELDKVILILNGKFEFMKECYKKMIENDGE